ncbi:gamma-glutamyl-gamma-aminobutyrate hydrolase family protein [Streptomyces sp. NBC_00487]|uniref:gamma-glutamyl-gamma-aminobutyrate hydrolase family protein n=1 Tax=unclassified Streptomyces TaxID=2593676 RepID=UPI002DDB1F7E|nr:MULTISPECIES: gamma-glutamyl-gamma-aminobutyrate hydrolase family protein [unclassified Streptomyces]WRZ00745.1 gamma-glutamyl-gamma-aminobutyrate hydrolase family protein [Streptomyces sp. NBC_00481]
MCNVVRRPLIAVTLGRDLPDRPSVFRLADSYVQALTSPGAIPIAIMPGIDDTAIRHVMEGVDGLFLPGGVDPHPRHFGEEVHPKTVIDEDLDALEMNAIAAAADLGMPILGICRGCQILNVALGGSLVQHLEPGGPVDHLQVLPLDSEVHELRIAAGSRLAGLSDARFLRVNSLHHQAVATPAPALRVVATAEDGTVEAVEATDPDRWIVGVQYHPEELIDQRAHRSLFDDFVSSCSRFAAARQNPEGSE